MEEIIKIGIYVTMGVLTILFLISYLIHGKKSNQENQDSLYEEKQQLLNAVQKQQKMKSFSEILFGHNQKRYLEVKLFLSKTGANYYVGRELEPIEYFAANVAFAFIFGFCGYRLIGVYGTAICILGYYFLGALLKESNKRDNETIMTDIQNVYSTLRLKTKGGMFLTGALMECYKVVRNKRLKSAILTLSSEISAKNNIDDSVSEFECKFDNQYINTFCVIIKQSLESGQTVKVLEDMSEQLLDVQNAANLREENKLDLQLTMIELLMFAGIMIVCAYCSMNGFGSNVVSSLF
jgi:hypothetical protein